MKNKYLEEVIYGRKEIQSSIKDAAKWANKEFKGTRTPVVVIGILNGSVPFFGQLLTQLKFPLIVDFVKLESFNGEERVKEPEFKLEIRDDIKKIIKNKPVLIVDDVLSTGKTAKMVYDELQPLNPKEIKFAFLFNQNNKDRIEKELKFKYYTCLNVENKFLVGYGLDYKGRYRNLDCVGTLKQKYIK